ncbi:MAG: hypothetical protein NTW03_00125 [Verrucomicrobia bacterium]|nr:hypothetical protein [Verrucomicrobiota bacterium]
MDESDDIDVTDLYTPLEEAKKEIWERWNNAALRQSVAELLGGIPEPFQKPP